MGSVVVAYTASRPAAGCGACCMGGAVEASEAARAGGGREVGRGMLVGKGWGRVGGGGGEEGREEGF